GWSHPVICRTGVVFLLSADEGDAFGAGYIIGIAAVEVTAGIGLLIQRGERAVAEHFLREALVLGLRAVAPHNFGRLRETGRLFDPAFQWRSHEQSSRGFGRRGQYPACRAERARTCS